MVIIFFAQFIKLLNYLLVFHFSGLYLNQIKNIIVKTAPFFVIYSGIIIFIAVVFRMLFYKISNDWSYYDTIGDSLFYSFSNPLGNFDLITSSTTGKNGYIQTMSNLYNLALLVYMFFMMVMMMNVLVAILSNVYVDVEDKGKMEMS